MKKYFILLFCSICIIATLFSFTACSKKAGLEQYVCELRQDVFLYSDQDITVKGGYGFIESPRISDGNISGKSYYLTLKLLNKETSDTTFTASLNFNEKDYSQVFKLNPVTHSLVATMQIDGFNLKTFNVTISSGSDNKIIEMKSILPDNTLTYIQALEFLQKEQPELIKAFSDADGNFTGEIYARIIVKDDKPYWYIGLSDKNNNLKALLVDGFNGEILAIREII